MQMLLKYFLGSCNTAKRLNRGVSHLTVESVTSSTLKFSSPFSLAWAFRIWETNLNVLTSVSHFCHAFLFDMSLLKEYAAWAYVTDCSFNLPTIFIFISQNGCWMTFSNSGGIHCDLSVEFKIGSYASPLPIQQKGKMEVHEGCK